MGVARSRRAKRREKIDSCQGGHQRLGYSHIGPALRVPLGGRRRSAYICRGKGAHVVG